MTATDCKEMVMIDGAEIARLRGIAKTAANGTTGRWETIFQGTRREEVTAVAEDGEIVLVCVLTDPDDAAHIAAFDPTTVLALLAELEQARELSGIAYKKQPADNIVYLTMLRASAYEQKGKDTYTWMDPDHVLSIIDALEQARKELDEWQAAMVDWTGQEAIKALLAERDAAQQSAKDARAMLREANEVLPDYELKRRMTVRARIEALLEQKP